MQDKLNNKIKSNKKTINIGPYQYLYEYLKNGEDFYNIDCVEKYVVLRNFDIINDIVYDKDIMFIEKSIYDKLINSQNDDLICYPIYKNGNLFFSNIYNFFTSYNIDLKDISYTIYQENIKNNEDNVDNVESEYDTDENGNIQLINNNGYIENNGDTEDNVESEYDTDEDGNIQLINNNGDIENNENIIANILCDKLRIYNPVINKNLDYIIYLDNYINNIHFHYFCNLNKNFKKQYTGEIKVNNSRYIEYIEINVPNIKKIFDEKNKYFIIEDFNKISFEKDFKLKKYFKKYNNNGNRIIEKCDNKLYLSEIIKPFIINKEKDESGDVIYIRTYITDKYFNYNNNFINTSLNITLYPYNGIQNGLYILHDLLNSSSTFIDYENYFRLSSRLSFDNGIISLINEFIFPNKTNNKSENYKYAYENLKNNFNHNKDDQEINIEIDENSQIVEYYNSYYFHENIDSINDLIKDHDDFDDDLDVEEIVETGFVIQFANDLNFNDIILESIIDIDSEKYNFIFDFSFSLNDIIDSWSQLNDILIMRARFIDKRLNVVITGNNVVVNKEKLKYFINDIGHYKIDFNKENNINNLIENNFMNISQGFNFIDNLNCTIVENNKNIYSSNNNVVNTKMIYKPIFYRVQELQNIRLRQGVNQKIGINLGEFMNKVNLFILNIGDITIKESSRNDVFVIFSVNANDIENDSGYYNIMDDNFEYISSGNYIKY